jgi:hypothetical protein
LVTISGIDEASDWQPNPALDGRLISQIQDMGGTTSLVIGYMMETPLEASTLELGCITSSGDGGDDCNPKVWGCVVNQEGELLTLKGGAADLTASTAPIRDALNQNWPNPFNPTTWIQYSISSDRQVKLKVYDVLGRTVKTLVDEFKSRNHYRILWDGTNDSGEAVASGIYFYQIQAGSYNATRKMVLLR